MQVEIYCRVLPPSHRSGQLEPLGGCLRKAMMKVPGEGTGSDHSTCSSPFQYPDPSLHDVSAWRDLLGIPATLSAILQPGSTGVIFSMKDIYLPSGCH